MYVKEIIHRSGAPSFGVARIFIEDGLTEMAISSQPWIKELTISLSKDRRFYTLPDEIIDIKDIIVINHMNGKGEYRSIPRLLNPPKVKDVVGTAGADVAGTDDSDTVNDYPAADDAYSVSDLNQHAGMALTDRLAGESGRDDKAREFAYFIEGDKLGIVERDLHQSSTGDIVNDTNAYQKAGYDWISPQANQSGSVKIRYAYIPIWNRTQTGQEIFESNTAIAGVIEKIESQTPEEISTTDYEATHTVFLRQKINVSTAAAGPVLDLRSNWAYLVGKLNKHRSVYMDNAGIYTGLWHIGHKSDATELEEGKLHVYPAQNRDKMALNPLADTAEEEAISLQRATALCYTNVESLYSEKEEFYLPIKSYLAQALVDYIKARMASEAGEQQLEMYYEKKFRSKLEKNETALISGPRMISPGPFAIK